MKSQKFNFKKFNTMLNKASFIAVLFFASVSCIGQVYSCKDPNGKTRFTDSKEKCHENVVELPYKKHRDLRADFRYPPRSYVKQESIYTIYIEKPESKADAVAFASATKKLTSTLNKIFAILPTHSHEYMMKIKFYIMIGPRAKLGGETRIFRYHAKDYGDGARLLSDREWYHSVVLYDVDEFNSLSASSAKAILVHELSHAWHFKNWNTSSQKVVDAWLASRGQGLYLAQKDLYGRMVKPAYATTNDFEYFAELSTAYFVGSWYYPFSKDDLKIYDPVGYNLIESVWSESNQ